jgi:TPR repeat protein
MPGINEKRRMIKKRDEGSVAWYATVVAASLLCFCLDTVASPETDRLSELAARGEQSAIESLIELARRDKDADAEHALGVLAYEGRGLERNFRQALQLFERAAAKGHPEASNMLGYFFEHGIGTNVDLPKAFAAYKRGAEAGSARARTNLGWFYEHGIGVDKNSATAAEWYTKAAEQGFAPAHANLANLYENGTGVKTNISIAISLYEMALASGIMSAAMRLGRLHEARANLGAATDHYLVAANAMVPGADLAAGRILVAAGNPRRNVDLGVHWLKQAAARGDQEATQLLVRLAGK